MKYSSKIIDKILITDLPVTDSFIRQKRLIQERGELALIEDGKEFKHLGYFSLLKGKGFRGGHYHINKTEHFYVIGGKLKIDLVDIKTGQKFNATIMQGQMVTIYPNCAHQFSAMEDAQVIEYYNNIYDVDDDVHYNFD
jgi:dTDP-4-dehydrorhamnose 3,5-epimerase-like enzyme